MNFLAFGANFISSWIRIRIQETNRMWIRIRNTAQQYGILYPRLFIPGPYPAIKNFPNSILDPVLLNYTGTILPKLKN